MPIVESGFRENSEMCFFLVVAPGLVSLAEKELKEKWAGIATLADELFGLGSLPEPELDAEPAGISIPTLPVRVGFLLNVCLKIPTRILMRVKQTRIRDFPKLFNRTRKIDWPSCLPGPFPEIHVSAHKSRLMHHRRIEETVSSAIRACFRDADPDADPQKKAPEWGSVYVRFDHDECVISLDTSGEALYRRSPGKKTGPAPIRETLAAAMFYKLWLTAPPSSGENFRLVDPMAGSGTFISEASTFWQTSQRRHFACERFPFMGLKQGGHLFPLEKSRHLCQRPLPVCFGFDLSGENAERAGENFVSAGLEVTVATCDLFSKEHFGPDRADWVFVNPPYGRRLETEQIFPFYYKHILSEILQKWRPGTIGMIVPADQLKQSFRVPPEYELMTRLSFLNGGLRVCFLILRLRGPEASRKPRV